MNKQGKSASITKILIDEQAGKEAAGNAKKLIACLTSSNQKSTVDWLVQVASLA